MAETLCGYPPVLASLDDATELPPTVGLPASYFKDRGITLDCRGPLHISASSYWGFWITVITQSHDPHGWPTFGPVVDYGVWVEDGAWIGSKVVLAGCRIGRQAIVAAGTVVRGQTVEPLTMVAGNPARVIARWDSGWRFLPAEASGYARVLA